MPRYRIVFTCADCPRALVAFDGATPGAGSSSGYRGVPLEDRAALAVFLLDHGPQHTIRVAVTER